MCIREAWRGCPFVRSLVEIRIGTKGKGAKWGANTCTLSGISLEDGSRFQMLTEQSSRLGAKAGSIVGRAPKFFTESVVWSKDCRKQLQIGVFVVADLFEEVRRRCVAYGCDRLRKGTWAIDSRFCTYGRKWFNGPFRWHIDNVTKFPVAKCLRINLLLIPNPTRNSERSSAVAFTTISFHSRAASKKYAPDPFLLAIACITVPNEIGHLVAC